MNFQNKIIIVVSPSREKRIDICKEVVCRMGFARIKSDASKLILPEVPDIFSTERYFVFCHSFDLLKWPVTLYNLITMAARGKAVVLGVKKVPANLEFLFEIVKSVD